MSALPLRADMIGSRINVWRLRKTAVEADKLLLTAELLLRQSAPDDFIVIASPLRSAFAISPTCRPERSRMAPFS